MATPTPTTAAPTSTDTQGTVSGTDIAQHSTVQSPDQAGNPSVVAVDAQASLVVEYVAATDTNSRPWAQNRYVQSLPNPIDDLTADFGSKIYEVDMLKDPQVYSTLSVLVMAVLARGITLTPPVPTSDPEYEAAKTIVRFLEYEDENLTHSQGTVAYELAEGMLKMGHKVGELIYVRETWEGQMRTMLRDIKCKPNEATAFVVDPFNNVMGLLYVRPGQPIPRIFGVGGQPVSVVGSPVPAAGVNSISLSDAAPTDGIRNEPRIIPRAKFIIPTHKPQNGDPRGTSHMRSIYTPWWKKQQLNPQHLAFVTRFAQPSMYAKLPANTRDIEQRDASGKSKSRKSIVQSTVGVVAQMKGGAAAALIDTDIIMLEAKGRAEVIFQSYEHEDKQIAKGMLMQTMTTEESQHMARSASAVHQDIFGIFLAFLRYILEECLEDDRYRKSVRYNFGEDAANRLTPEVGLGDVQVQDVPAMMASLAQLANTKNGIHWTQWPAIWRMIGLPAADQEVWLDDMQRQDKVAQAQAEAVINPPPVPVAVGAGGPPTAPGQAPPTRKPPPARPASSPSAPPKGG